VVVGVTPDVVGKVKAGELAGQVAGQLGGRGGGRADFAQAGGNDASKLEVTLAAVPDMIRARLA
jgi:alanyl-tRNA synthetase